MTINKLVTEDFARESFENYVIGRNLASGQGPRFSLVSSPLESKIEPVEANKPQYRINIIENDEEIMKRAKEVMPDCCKVHQDEFKADLNVNLTFSEQKMPLITQKSRVFEPILRLYDALEKFNGTLEYATSVVKETSYNINQKISSLYNLIKDSFAHRMDYSKNTISYSISLTQVPSIYWGVVTKQKDLYTRTPNIINIEI